MVVSRMALSILYSSLMGYFHDTALLAVILWEDMLTHDNNTLSVMIWWALEQVLVAGKLVEAWAM